jgi:hypothetical protein
VAEKTGCSLAGVRGKRMALGIANPVAWPTHPWTAEEDELVRALRPVEAAERTGRPLGAIHKRRMQLDRRAAGPCPMSPATGPGNSLRFRSWPTPLESPAALTPPSWATCAHPARTDETAGRWASFWADRESESAPGASATAAPAHPTRR